MTDDRRDIRSNVMNAYISHELQIGNLMLGGKNPVRIQSMLNTNTADIKGCIEQSAALFDAGCELVRISVPSVKDVQSIRMIAAGLRSRAYKLPLIADVHFNPKIAEEVAPYVEKIRINPGNYYDRKLKNTSAADYHHETERIAERIKPLIKICKENDTVLRIGSNHGSLSERIIHKYGNTPLGMLESAMEFVMICKSFGFEKIVLSMKSSNVGIMLRSYELLAERLRNEGMFYPIHLGVTEAGSGHEGRLRSAAGTGSLLLKGIGDTIRVSLSEDPLSEIPFAKSIINAIPGENGRIKNSQYEKYEQESIRIKGEKCLVVADYSETESYCRPDFYPLKNDILISASETAEKKKYAMLKVYAGETLNLHDIDFIVYEPDTNTLPAQLHNLSESVIKEHPHIPLIMKLSYSKCDDNTLAHFGTFASYALLHNLVSGIWLNAGPHSADYVFSLLQSTGVRISDTEFISCPTCGRTSFDLAGTLEKVKELSRGYKGLKIAVMGCVVNGPGEMADADLGFVGAGKGKVNIYKGKELIHKGIKEENALQLLKHEIENFEGAKAE